MHFEWDESKNAINVRKHKIDFADVLIVFEGLMLIDYDDRQDFRIISARKANQNECERYYEEAI